MTTDSPIEKPLRADAARNRGRLLEAAAATPTTNAKTSAGEIARRAGVVMGTHLAQPRLPRARAAACYDPHPASLGSRRDAPG